MLKKRNEQKRFTEQPLTLNAQQLNESVLKIVHNYLIVT